MQKNWLIIVLAVIGTAICAFDGGTTRADILVRSDSRLVAGKVVSQNDNEVVFQADGAASPEHIARSAISRVILTDEHGGVLPDKGAAAHLATQPAAHWNIPAEPAAPPVDPRQIGTPAHPTYYVIPLQGEVGETILAGALEKSLKDAAARKPSVVVLDISSPGGLIAEAQQIIKVLHQYNKSLRIVALTDQDLSAAAIISLSVRKIYVKSTSTIGAATAYDPTNLRLPANLNEKMQSAWRAVARNSAEEGGHEPLLAEAMIDNGIELHLETVVGKPVIKEGPGDHELCRKGRILTLTSHEAIECGLAAGSADDVDALGKELNMPGWTECKGLGTALADYLPKRAAVMKAQLDGLRADYMANLQQAASDGAAQVMLSSEGNRITGYNKTVVTQGGPRNPLGCVLALQAAEKNLRDAISLYHAFDADSSAENAQDSLSRVVAARAQMYDDRNKGAAAGAFDLPVPSAQPRISIHVGAQPAAVTVSEAERAAKLKKIPAIWQPSKETPRDILANMQIGGAAIKPNADGTVTLPAGQQLTTTEFFRPPVTFRIVAMTDRNNIRFNYPLREIIFDWENNEKEFRLWGDPIGLVGVPDKGYLAPNQWAAIEIQVLPNHLTIWADGQERYSAAADFSRVNEPLQLFSNGSTLQIKSVSVLRAR